jgi:hypothetical protein
MQAIPLMNPQLICQPICDVICDVIKCICDFVCCVVCEIAEEGSDGRGGWGGAIIAGSGWDEIVAERRGIKLWGDVLVVPCGEELVFAQ